MKEGRTKMAIGFRRDVTKDKNTPLDDLLTQEGWKYQTEGRSKRITKNATHGGLVEGLYFKTSDRRYATFNEIAREIMGDEMEGIEYAMIFLSDLNAQRIASCYMSMLNRHRNSLAHRLQKEYGNDDVLVMKADSLDIDDN